MAPEKFPFLTPQNRNESFETVQMMANQNNLRFMSEDGKHQIRELRCTQEGFFWTKQSNYSTNFILGKQSPENWFQFN